MERRKQSSSRKRQDADRLSSLPDSILCYILSFLPTKSSAATSILARRWRFLWADVPNIDLDFPSYVSGTRNGLQFQKLSTGSFFFGHNLKALNTFQLKHTRLFAKDCLTQHLIKSWIAAVTRRGKVRNIELEFTNLIMMPECLFAYKSLVELRLYRCEIRISEPVSLSFPSLAKLHLCFIKYNNDETFQHLISGCSILEELVIKYLVPGDLDCYRIFSPTLKSLTIESGFYHRQNHTVERITPALLYLQLNGSSFKRITAQLLSFLIEADLDLVMATDVVFVRSLLEFLDRMSNVKRLKFEVNYEKLLLGLFSISSPRFHSLTKLELVAAGWPLMLNFLKIADNLQVIIINWDPEDFDECWVEPQEVITCLLSHLRSIVIDSFWWAEYELSMVRYLLKNAKVLTSIKIHCQVTVGCHKGKLDVAQKKKSDAIQRISLFERGSKTCKLDIN